MFYGELNIGKWPRHKPKKRFKDRIEDNLKVLQINNTSWDEMTQDRNEWRKTERDVLSLRRNGSNKLI